MIKVAFVEDDPSFLQSAVAAIHMQPDLHCLFTANSVEAFWAVLPPKATIDVLFLDIDLPGQSGVASLPAFRRRFPEAELVMLTNMEDADLLLQALHNGAGGYLTKNFPIFQLPQHIRTICDGGAMISPLMARKLVRHFHPTTQPGATDVLNTKEKQILQLFSQGHTYEETAALIGLSIDGVRYHVRNIYKKLNVDSKIDALKVFQQS